MNLGSPLWRLSLLSSTYPWAFFHSSLLSKERLGCILVIPALQRLRQEDRRFKASLGYIVRTCLRERREREEREGRGRGRRRGCVCV
jgi:hypothetical protein